MVNLITESNKINRYTTRKIIVQGHDILDIDLRERSHMTSAAEGGGGFEMLTVADKGGEGV